MDPPVAVPQVIPLFFISSMQTQESDAVNEMLNDKLFEYLSDYVKIKVLEESTNELRKKQAA